MAEDVKSLARNWYTVLGSKDLKGLDEAVAPGFVDHALPPGFPAGKEGVRRYFAGLHSAFSDLRFNVEDIIAEGDKAAARVTGQATQSGEFMGVQPTGKPVTVRFMDFLRFENGKLAEHWGIQDLLHMMQQLGLSSGPGRGPSA